MEHSRGEIKVISEDNFTIQHTCNTETGSSGGPILNTDDYRVLGIHKGSAPEGKNYNLGSFLKEPLEEFMKEKENKIENNKGPLTECIKENENKIENNKETEEEYIKENENQTENNKKEDIKNNIENEIKKNNDVLISNDDEIIIEYKINNNSKEKIRIRIFGDKFVENNKNKCKIIMNGKEYELFSHVTIDQLNNNIYKIKLKGINQITDASYMFDNCSELSSLPDISKWDTKNVTNMSCMFKNCKSLSSLPDISKWDTKNVTNISYMFFNCKSLSSLPDISKWNTTNVKDRIHMLDGCSLPDNENIKKINFILLVISSFMIIFKYGFWDVIIGMILIPAMIMIIFLYGSEIYRNKSLQLLLFFFLGIFFFFNLYSIILEILLGFILVFTVKRLFSYLNDIYPNIITTLLIVFIVCFPLNIYYNSEISKKEIKIQFLKSLNQYKRKNRQYSSILDLFLDPFIA